MAEPLFQPFRALGYITDSVPFAVNRRGKETWATFSVGKSWQIYNCAKLSLTLVGPQFPTRITALACKGDFTYAATGSSIVVCKRVHHVHTWAGHSAPIVQLLVFGGYLISLCKGGQLMVWPLNMSSQSPSKVMDLEAGFEPTCMAHPPTYVNKLVVGAADGRLQLWNVNTASLIYTFAGWGAAVCCIEPSPALDVVGVGLADGSAVLVNLKYDEVVVKFGNAAGVGAGSDLLVGGGAGAPGASGACSCIAFRSGVGPPLMAAGGGAGVITVWHLEERKLQTVVKDAHGAPLAALHFFPGEPVLMSAGGDNAAVQWIFDNEDGSARRLRGRAGHAAPPRCVRHYGPDGAVLLSAAEDRELRAFSIIQDQQSRELSQVHTKRRAKRLRVAETDLKLPPAVALSASATRERDWANVLTAHTGDPTAYTWELAKYRLADQELTLPPKERLDGTLPAPVTAVCVSHCGNFGFVGSADGRLDRYNMQSAFHRGHYCRTDPAAPGARLRAHDSAVVGIGCDACNQLLASVDHRGVVRTWAFKTGAPRAELPLGSEVGRFCMHAHSALAAAACADAVVRVLDVQQARVVRHFRGHTDRLTDVTVSDDGKWVLSASLDGTVRVWDIPTAACLQAMRLGCPVTCLSLSPTMELLATAHVNRRGIYLWSNQLLFGGGAGVLPSSAVVDVRLPTVATGHHDGGAAAADGAEVAGGWDSDADWYDSDDDPDASSQTHADSDDEAAEAAGRRAAYRATDASGLPVPLAAGLLTLSGEPASKWESLVHLDAIKARNKPTEAPKKPEAAPFFLPSAPALSGAPAADAAAAGAVPVANLFGADTLRMTGADVEGGEGAAATAAASQVLRNAEPHRQTSSGSALLQLLREGAAAGHFAGAVAWLRRASPVGVEREVCSMALLEPYDEDDIQAVALLLRYVTAQLEASQNFDHVQGLLALVLRVHGESIAAVPLLAELAHRIYTQMSHSWSEVDDAMHAIRCMISMFGDMQF